MPPAGVPPAMGLPETGVPPHPLAPAAKALKDMLGLLFLVALVFNILAAIWIYTDIRKRGEGRPFHRHGADSGRPRGTHLCGRAHRRQEDLTRMQPG